MSRLLLEGGIIVLLVLIGVSIFVGDSSQGVESVIVEFESSIEKGEEIEDGNLEDVKISKENNSNFVSKVNCKIANTIVNGLNNIFELGMKVLRVVLT